MIRKGSFVVLHGTYTTFPVSSQTNDAVGEGNPIADTLQKKEIALVLQVRHPRAKILTPRGKAGWVWISRLLEV